MILLDDDFGQHYTPGAGCIRPQVNIVTSKCKRWEEFHAIIARREGDKGYFIKSVSKHRYVLPISAQAVFTLTSKII